MEGLLMSKKEIKESLWGDSIPSMYDTNKVEIEDTVPSSWIVKNWYNPTCPLCLMEEDIQYALQWDGEKINSIWSCCNCRRKFLRFGDMIILKGGDDMGSNEFLWNKFYMCLTRAGKSTSKRHATLELAKEEAERLCNQEECEVAILTVTDICVPERPPITWTKPKE